MFKTNLMIAKKHYFMPPSSWIFILRRKMFDYVFGICLLKEEIFHGITVLFTISYSHHITIQQI